MESEMQSLTSAEERLPTLTKPKEIESCLQTIESVKSFLRELEEAKRTTADILASTHFGVMAKMKIL